MYFFRYLNDAHHLARQIEDWDNPMFDWRKSFIACVYSASAYEEIQEFELIGAKRAKVIPCDSFQATFANRRNGGNVQSLTRRDTGQTFFVIAQPRVVVIVTKIRGVIFIALRGTTLSFADFRADLDARKVRYPATGPDPVRFHRGFLEAVLDCYDEVMDRVNDLREADTPIYVTGHSLGGAMAAIFHAKLLREWDDTLEEPSPTTCCYTFGMPRFVDIGAKHMEMPPYHVFNQFDAVPTLPPTFMGFADCGVEYCIDARPEVVPILFKGNAGFRKSKGIATLLKFSDHRMERYLERLDFLQKRLPRPAPLP